MVTGRNLKQEKKWRVRKAGLAKGCDRGTFSPERRDEDRVGKGSNDNDNIGRRKRRYEGMEFGTELRIYKRERIGPATSRIFATYRSRGHIVREMRPQGNSIGGVRD
jgi:hypothetical protein